MSYRVLDPTSETGPGETILAPRMDSLAGKTVGFLSNGKEGTKGFFAHLERVLRDEWQVRNVVHVVKPNFSAPAGAALVDDTAHWDLAITGIGD